MSQKRPSTIPPETRQDGSDDPEDTGPGFILTPTGAGDPWALVERIDFEDDGGEMTSTERRLPAAADASVAPFVLVLSGLSAGKVVHVGERGLRIGRTPGLDLVLQDAGVSREHCTIERDGVVGSFVIEDHDSTNGTWVGQARVRRLVLTGEERIRIGSDVVLRFALSDATEEELAKRLYEGAMRDALTACYSRRYFDDRMPAEVAYATRHQSPLGVLMIDVDHFKRVNDALGHSAGDDVLRGVGRRILDLVRTEDSVVRFGGEEFLILVRGVAKPGLVDLGERIRAALSRSPVESGRGPVAVTVSVGVAMLDESHHPQALLELADVRLYRAKSAGRNRVASE